jgi:lysophospholipase L1-like esterase
MGVVFLWFALIWAMLARESKGLTLLDYLSERNLSILCFGDSLTKGHYPLSRKEGGPRVFYKPYSMRLQMLLDNAVGLGKIQVINVGIDGEHTDNMSKRMPRELAKYNSNNKNNVGLAIILGGTNDMVRGPSAGGVSANLDAVHAAAHRAKAFTIAITLPALHWIKDLPESQKKRLDVNSHLRDFQLSNSSRVIGLLDLENRWIPQDDETNRVYWSFDRAHFSEQGYFQIGDLLFSIVSTTVLRDDQAFTTD